MNRPRTQPAIPATVIAAAVMLSFSTAADVTVAAVLMNAGRQVPARALANAESLGQWLTRFTDAARQMRDVFTGDESRIAQQAHSADIGRAHFPLSLSLTTRTTLEQHQICHEQPILVSLTDLPPPAR